MFEDSHTLNIKVRLAGSKGGFRLQHANSEPSGSYGSVGFEILEPDLNASLNSLSASSYSPVYL
jgi:hypothetical protein